MQYRVAKIKLHERSSGWPLERQPAERKAKLTLKEVIKGRWSRRRTR